MQLVVALLDHLGALRTSSDGMVKQGFLQTQQQALQPDLPNHLVLFAKLSPQTTKNQVSKNSVSKSDLGEAFARKPTPSLYTPAQTVPLQTGLTGLHTPARTYCSKYIL